MDNAALIKERVDIRALAESYGVQFNPRGAALCPFHNDKHPSASVKHGRFHCYVCDLHLDIYDFARHMDGCNFPEAMARINELFGLGLNLNTPVPREEITRRKKERERRQAELDICRADYDSRHVLFISTRQLRDAAASAGRGDIAAECILVMDRLEEWFCLNSRR